MPIGLTQNSLYSGRCLLQKTNLAAGSLFVLNASEYSGNGDVWPGVCGTNKNATLYNSPSFNTTYFSFNADNVQYASTPTLGDLNRWSIEAWFRLNAPLTTKEATSLLTTVYFVPGGSAPGVVNFCIGSHIPSIPYSDKLAVGFFDGAWHQTEPFTPTLNTWYHVVGTYDGNTLKQYINGEFNSEINYAGTSTANNGEIRIARRWDDVENSKNYFPGDIGVIGVYSSLFNSSHIKTKFASLSSIYQ